MHEAEEKQGHVLARGKISCTSACSFFFFSRPITSSAGFQGAQYEGYIPKKDGILENEIEIRGILVDGCGMAFAWDYSPPPPSLPAAHPLLHLSTRIELHSMTNRCAIQDRGFPTHSRRRLHFACAVRSASWEGGKERGE